MKYICLFFVLTIFPLFAAPKFDPEAAPRQLEKYGEYLAKKNHMILISKGVGTVVDSRKVLYDINLMSHHFWTIDEARPYVVGIMQELWYLVHQDPKILSEIEELRRQDILLVEFTPAAMGMKINFWDQDVNRPMPPYLARIIVADGEIRYYQANRHDQSLKEPFVETMDQAIEKTNQK